MYLFDVYEANENSCIS